ncbi:MFS general substrate transporter [Stipitochalara longipes BDJ]|nr:MFS general substrate transporter [Stipitochalara longipes BDJ]
MEVDEQRNGPAQNTVAPKLHAEPKTETEQPTTPFSLRPREKIVMLALMIMAGLTCLEATSIGVALPIIAHDLHATSVQAIWAGTSYLLSSTVAQPAFASYSHIFGRLGPTLFAVIAFAVGSVVCGVAQDIATLLVGRTIQGLGSGGCIAMTEVLITDLVPLRSRAAYFGLVSLSWALGSALGPIMGGGFAQNASWRWIFWFLLPLQVLALIIFPLFLRLKPREGHILEKIKSIDYTGTFLYTTSSTGFLIAISWGGIMFSWSSWHTLVPLILGLFGLGCFVLYDVRVATAPLIPFQIFATRTAAVGYYQITINGMAMWAAVYYLPLYFEAIKGYSPLITGVALFPDTLLVAPVAAITGAMIEKFGKYQKILWVGWFLATFGFGLMIYLRESTTVPQWIFLNCVAGVGMGLTLPTMQISVQAAARDEDMAFAAAMVSILRTFGQTLGLAIFGIVFQNVLENELKGTIFASQAQSLSLNALTLVQTIQSLPSGTEEREVLLHAFMVAVRAVWIACVPFMLSAFIASAFTQELSLDRVLFTEHGVQYEDEVPSVETGESKINSVKMNDNKEPSL